MPVGALVPSLDTHLQVVASRSTGVRPLECDAPDMPPLGARPAKEQTRAIRDKGAQVVAELHLF